MERGKEQSALVRSAQGLDGQAVQLYQFVLRDWLGGGTLGNGGL